MALPVCVIVNISAHSDGAAHVELGRFFKAAGIQIEIKLTTSMDKTRLFEKAKTLQ